jgi:hypothetical protein
MGLFNNETERRVGVRYSRHNSVVHFLRNPGQHYGEPLAGDGQRRLGPAGGPAIVPRRTPRHRGTERNWAKPLLIATSANSPVSFKSREAAHAAISFISPEKTEG